VVLVEGITDALLLRQLGRAWAGTDQRKSDRVEALTIVRVGTRVGEWTIALLATPSYELVQRVAILSDTDHRPTTDPPPSPPGVARQV
jgi:putative ATP-dependent endonuclease of the OLD family